jgi:hypothetical protein
VIEGLVRIKEGGRPKKRDPTGNIHIYIKVINASSILEMVNIEQSMLVSSLRSSMAKLLSLCCCPFPVACYHTTQHRKVQLILGLVILTL